MKIKCSKCDNFIQSKIGIYRYKESGLDNVFLQNIPVYECSCGVLFPSIFRVSLLNELISKTLLKKPALLNGSEIKFLRKSLYMSSKDFARKLGVEKTTFSKWENDLQRHREPFDRFIRLLYVSYKGIKGKGKKELLEMYDKRRLKKSDIEYIITAEKDKDSYIVNYRPVLEGWGQKPQIVWMTHKKKARSISSSQNFVLEISQTESNIMFSSEEVLSTSTILIHT